jgi:acetylornithine/succinyldiaminopimelate/putrescine aminotransferase
MENVTLYLTHTLQKVQNAWQSLLVKIRGQGSIQACEHEENVQKKNDEVSLIKETTQKDISKLYLQFSSHPFYF